MSPSAQQSGPGFRNHGERHGIREGAAVDGGQRGVVVIDPPLVPEEGEDAVIRVAGEGIAGTPGAGVGDQRELGAKGERGIRTEIEEVQGDRTIEAEVARDIHPVAGDGGGVEFVLIRRSVGERKRAGSQGTDREARGEDAGGADRHAAGERTGAAEGAVADRRRSVAERAVDEQLAAALDFGGTGVAAVAAEGPGAAAIFHEAVNSHPETAGGLAVARAEQVQRAGGDVSGEGQLAAIGLDRDLPAAAAAGEIGSQ